MTPQQITDRVIEIIADDYFLPEDIKLTDSIYRDFGYDYIDARSLCRKLQNEFNISISYESVESWYTVQDVVTTVLKLTGNAKEST